MVFFAERDQQDYVLVLGMVFFADHLHKLCQPKPVSANLCQQTTHLHVHLCNAAHDDCHAALLQDPPEIG
jgi:hypothetical protein